MRKSFLFLCFFIASISTSYAQDYFVTTWNTEAGTGQTGNTTIKLPLSGGAYDVDVNNDGDFDDAGVDLTNQTGTITIDFETGNAGTKTIRVRANPTNNASKQLQIKFFESGVEKKLTSIDKWGDIVWTSMANAFTHCTNMTIANNAGVPNLTNVLSTHGMFSGTTNFNSDLNAWNVSNVTDMSVMFGEATGFSNDLSNWDVSNVNNMRAIFRGTTGFKAQDYNALLVAWSSLPSLQNNVDFGAPPVNYCADGEAGRNTLTGTYSWSISGDGSLSCPFITTWNTEAGTGQNGNTTIELPITEGVYDIDSNNDGTFNMTNLQGKQTIDLGSAGTHTIAIRPNAANTANRLRIKFGIVGSKPEKLITVEQWGSIVWTSMNGAFQNCSNIAFSKNVGIPDLTEVTDMTKMFSAARNFNGDLSAWNVSQVTNMNAIFSTARKFASDLSSWNVSNVIDMSHMFSGGNSSFNSDLSSWDVSNVAKMSNMFASASSFNGNLSNWDVSNVIDMQNMFGATRAFNGDISNWNVSNVTNMSEMFSFNNIFNSDLSNWNVSNVNSMVSIFFGTEKFDGDLSNWNVSNVTSMDSMFFGAFSFTSDLSNWDVSNVTNMGAMFFNATSFRAEDYNSLLLNWPKLNLQNDVLFTPPPTTYCTGKAGRDKLINTYSWSISGDTGFNCPDNLLLSIDVFLQGPYDTSSNMMGDGLRAASVIPTTSPYGDGATIESTALDVVTGEESNAIVDWVQVSLHDPNDTSTVICIVPALLQRDGDVVALDGGDDLTISGVAGNYHVSINHRNHIPVITDAAQSLSTTETAIDFTNDLTIVTGGSNAIAKVATGIYALFSGDINGNNQVQVDDYNAAIQDVGRGGYLTSDVDMNGELQVSDINFVLKTLGKGAQF